MLLLAVLVGPPAPNQSHPGPSTPETALAPAPRPLGWGWYAFAAGGQAADVVTTVRFRAVGIREGNHVVGGLSDHPVELGLVKVGGALALTAGMSALSVRAERHGCRWQAWVARSVPVVVGALGVAAAIHNERELSRHHAGPSR